MATSDEDIQEFENNFKLLISMDSAPQSDFFAKPWEILQEAKKLSLREAINQFHEKTNIFCDAWTRSENIYSDRTTRLEKLEVETKNIFGTDGTILIYSVMYHGVMSNSNTIKAFLKKREEFNEFRYIFRWWAEMDEYYNLF